MLQSIYTHAGCDSVELSEITVMASFNPHTHAGCDRLFNLLRKQTTVSIHTPTQGVTYLYVKVKAVFDVSIHTPTQGVTYYNWQHPTADHVSIHTPTQGVTDKSL